MSTFRFRLATLLKLRESARDERRRVLAEAFQAAATLQEQLDQTEQELGELRGVYGAASSPGQVVLDRLVDAQRYEMVLRSQASVLREQSRMVAEEIERRRMLLVEADREVRVLEKLREKQEDRHTQQLEREDLKLMDELAGRIRREAAQS